MEIYCEKCGGSLEILADGRSKCINCGTMYPLTWLENKLSQIENGSPANSQNIKLDVDPVATTTRPSSQQNVSNNVETKTNQTANNSEGVKEPIQANQKEEKAEEKPKKEKKEKSRKKLNAKTVVPIIISILIVVAVVGGLLLKFVIIPKKNYDKAVDLMYNLKTEQALEKFDKLGDNYKDVKQKKFNCRQYSYCKTSVADEDEECDLISIKEDGTLLLKFSSSENGAKEVKDGLSECKNVVSVDCNMYYDFYVVSRDGTVKVVGLHNLEGYQDEDFARNTDYGQTDVSDWTDIVQVATGSYATIGLKTDGTCVATTIKSTNKNEPLNEIDHGQTNVSTWTDIVQIVTNDYFTAGLKSDGSVVVTQITNTENNEDLGERSEILKVCNDWSGISELATEELNLYGLTFDGTLVFNYDPEEDDKKFYDLLSATGVKAIFAEEYQFAYIDSQGNLIKLCEDDDEYTTKKIAIEGGANYCCFNFADSEPIVTTEDGCISEINTNPDEKSEYPKGLDKVTGLQTIEYSFVGE